MNAVLKRHFQINISRMKLSLGINKIQFIADILRTIRDFLFLKLYCIKYALFKESFQKFTLRSTLNFYSDTS